MELETVAEREAIKDHGGNALAAMEKAREESIAVLFSTSLADEKGREIGKRPEMARRSRITFSFQFRRGREGRGIVGEWCWLAKGPYRSLAKRRN